MIPTYQIFIENSDDLQIAVCKNPAIEENFLFFDSDKRVLMFDKYKKEISGPVMVPNLKIYRNQPVEHYVYYDEDTIVKASQLFFKNGMKFNYKHSTQELPIDIYESYLTKEDKEFGNLPKGSWIVTAKVLDDKIFDEIVSGDLQGFSFQGLFSYSQEVEYFAKIKEKNMEKSLKERLFDALNSVFFNETEQVKEEETEKVEEFEAVETQEVEAVVEEVVEEVALIVEEAPAQILTIDEVKVLLETMKSQILTKVSEMIKPVEDKVEDVEGQVQEFAKQPITQSVTVEEKVIDKNLTRAERIIALRKK